VDVVLFTRVTRCIKQHIAAANAADDKEELKRAEDALGACILPALGLIRANPGAVNEVWNVLSSLPVTTRFRLYSEWKTIFTASEKPTFAAAKVRLCINYNLGLPLFESGWFQTLSLYSEKPVSNFGFKWVNLDRYAKAVAESDTQKVMRRLSKDNVKEFGRKLGKVAHGNPLAVMQAIVVQIEAYTNMISPVCDAFKYLTALGYDVLTFVVIEKLAEGREKLKDDGQNVSLWLSALATFCGHLAKKYAGIELGALLQYLVNTLKDNQSLDLLVLKELITRMAGNEALEDMSDAQVQAMAGGETLKSEAINFNSTMLPKVRAKGVARLRDALQKGAKGGDALTIPLLVLIAQCRQAIIFKTDSKHLKLVSQLYDGCQETFFHYCDFLTQAYDDEKYATMLPSLRALVGGAVHLSNSTLSFTAAYGLGTQPLTLSLRAASGLVT
jgi:THO complex subunit 2